jgi:CIC family chloride channel protein
MARTLPAPAVPRDVTPRPPASGNPYIRDLLETSLLAAIIGTTMGFVALGVRAAIAFVTGLLFRGEITTDFAALTTDFQPPAVHEWGVLVVFVPAVGALLAWGIAKSVAHEDRIRGVAEIIDIVMRRRAKVSPRSVTGNAVATIVSVGSGGSAGREGAMVQIGAAVGMIASLFSGASIRHRKILIAAGGAGAIAATFNTPIAGVIFAAEVILLEWSTRSFVPLSISSAFSVTVATYFLGDQPAFPIPAYELVATREILLYVVLGLLAGLLAITTFRTLETGDRVFALLRIPSWSKPVLGGLLVGLIGLFIPQVFGVGYETVRVALAGEFAAWALGLILVAKLVAFSLTRGSGGASGAFSPSLFLGAALGGAFGEIVNSVWPTWTASSGAYALVGMAAVYAAVTRASLTAVVMLYEMTHTFSIIIPVMIAVVIADGLSKAYAGTTLYAPRDARRRKPVETDVGVNILDIVPVGEIMTRKVETLHADAPVRQIVEKRFRTGHQGYPVLDGRGQLVGIITATDLRTKVKDEDLDKPIKRYMTPNPVTVTPTTTAHEALTEMVRLDVGHLPVVADDAPRRLVGFLTRQDLIGVERRVIEEERPGESVFDRLGDIRPPWRRIGP